MGHFGLNLAEMFLGWFCFHRNVPCVPLSKIVCEILIRRMGATCTVRTWKNSFQKSINMALVNTDMKKFFKKNLLLLNGWSDFEMISQMFHVYAFSTIVREILIR